MNSETAKSQQKQMQIQRINEELSKATDTAIELVKLSAAFELTGNYAMSETFDSMSKHIVSIQHDVNEILNEDGEGR